jgi:signal transduction histidine kinase
VGLERRHAEQFALGPGDARRHARLLLAAPFHLDGGGADGERLAATVREHAQRITASVEEANHVIDELLRFGQDRTLHVYPCSLAELIGECIAAVAPQAAERRVTLVVAPTADVVVPLDKRKLTQVIDNLLDNALEASPAGTAVEIALSHDDAAAHIAIRDQGPGVAAHVRARLFTPFCTTKPDGIGLGLALARELAEAHGGGVRHEPSPPGACFVLDLPIAGPHGR